MKKYTRLFLGTILFTSTIFHATAQDSIREMKKIGFRTTLFTTGKISRGFIQHIGDSLVTISPKAVRFNPGVMAETANTFAVPYHTINKMTVARKGGTGRGAMIGSISGILVGVITGFISGDDKLVPPEENFLGLPNMFKYTAGEKAVFGGAVGFISGGIIGGIIGSISKKFFIKGNKKNFDDMHQFVLGKTYKKILDNQ